jgi:anti-anti-sigma regulatory factor
MLTIAVAHEQARIPVAVLSLEGELDAASYLEAIETARQLISDGTTHILLDLENLSYMGSSGLFVLQSVAMMLRGQAPPDPEGGWGAIHQAAGDQSDSSAHLKLLSPQPQVDRVLDRSGMKRFFETYTDRAEALGAF